MKTLFLHIGYHKTGTTSLQNYLWKNRCALRDRGVLYPDVGIAGPAHGVLANVLRGERWQEVYSVLKPEFLPAEEDIYAVDKGVTAESLYQELYDEIWGSSCSKIVISSECFLEWIPPQLIHEHFSKLECQIKVVIYVREQVSWICSVFNQLVKDRFFRYSGELGELPQLEYLDYWNVINSWAEAFGTENIILRVYDEVVAETDTVHDFLNVIDAPVFEGEKLDSSDEFNLNVHSSLIGMLQYVNSLSLSLPEHTNILAYLRTVSALMPKEASNPACVCLSELEAGRIRNQYYVGNKSLAQKFLGRDDSELFSISSAHGSKWENNEHSSDYSASASRVISEQVKKIRKLSDEKAVADAFIASQTEQLEKLNHAIEVIVEDKAEADRFIAQQQSELEAITSSWGYALYRFCTKIRGIFAR